MISEAIGRLMGAMGGPMLSGPTPSHSDNRMISKSLRSLAAQADEIHKRISCGDMELPSWAEYKVYKAHDAIKDALSATYGAEPQRKMMIIIRKSHDDGAKKALEDAGLTHSITGDSKEKTASQALDDLLDKLAKLNFPSLAAGTKVTNIDVLSDLLRAAKAGDGKTTNRIFNKYPNIKNNHVARIRRVLAQNQPKTASMREDHLEFLAQNPSMNAWRDKGVGVLSMNMADGSATAHTSGEMPVRDTPETYRRKILGGAGGAIGAGLGSILGGAAGALGSTYFDASDENKRLATVLGLLGGAALGGAGGGYYGYQHGKMQDEMSSITPDQVQGAMQRLNAVPGVRVPSLVQDPGGDSLRFYHHDAPDSPETIRAINKAIYGD